MSQYTQEKIEAMVEGRFTLNNLAEEYFWQRYNADPKFRQIEEPGSFYPDGREFHYRPSIKNISISGDDVHVRCTARACGCGCCGYDNHTFRFPLSYLWQDQSEILADMARRQQEAADAKRQAEKEAEEKRKREREEYERKQLKKLTAKYPEVVS